LTKQLESLQREEQVEHSDHIQQIQGDIDRLLEMKDLRWKQREKQNWAINGDRNTKFFLAWATQRRRKNHISRIWDSEGREWTDQEDVGRAFSNFSQSLFTSLGLPEMDHCLAPVSH
jgi:hypothetical protein